MRMYRIQTQRACHFCCFPMRYVFALLLSLVIFLIIYSLNLNDLPDPPLPQQQYFLRPGFIVDTPGCHIPDLDPFDKSIRHLIIKTKPVRCDSSLPPTITYIDGEWLRINQTALRLYYDDKLDYCEYQEILRPEWYEENPDNAYSYSQTVVKFTSDFKITAQFIRLACYGQKGGMLYSNFHAFILTKPKLEQEADEKFEAFRTSQNSKETLNVLALGVDAMSRLNFMRQMPKTRRYILRKLQGIELKGMNKVADNTFVNLVPMLAGKFVEELPWDEMDSSKPFDEFTFLWNNFSDRGYRTLFAEDAPRISTFNYGKEGFHKEPVDYYLRPFSLALEEHGSIWSKNRICVGTKQETEVVLDYVKEFITRFKDKPYFALAFITRLTHDNLNRPGIGEDLYYEFFKWMHESGHLNNTAVMFFSDHGIRFGEIRETYIGKLEERLPFAYVIMPPWFAKKYPLLWKNLQDNQNKLTTPFDYFETMKELLQFDGQEKAASVKDRGISLFSNITLERTCEHAGIIPHWCTCHQKEPISSLDTTVRKATDAVIGYINQKLHHNNMSPCAFLKLKKITDALKLLSNNDILGLGKTKRKKSVLTITDTKYSDTLLKDKDMSDIVVDYLITFIVSPGDGMFEATVRHSIMREEEEFNVIGDISRINAYGDTAHCMPNYSLQKYCHCM